MWTTLDGYRLRLPRSGNTLITAQSPGTGRQASLRRPDGSLDPSSVQFIGRIVGSSTRIGALRATWSDRRYPVFTANVNGPHYQTITGPSTTPGELVILAVRPEVRRFSGEFSDGRGHRIVQDSIYDWLVAQGLQDSRELPANLQQTGEGIRDNQAQLRGLDQTRDLRGRPYPNKPDLSYLAAIGPGGSARRVNVEIDTTAAGSRNHERTLIRNDPHSMHVFVVVHPVTGQVISRRVYDPARDFATRRTRTHSSSLSLPAPMRPRQQQARGAAPPPRLPVQAINPRQDPSMPRSLAGARLRPMRPGNLLRVPPRSPLPQVLRNRRFRLVRGPRQTQGPPQGPAQQSLFPTLPRREFESAGFF